MEIGITGASGFIGGHLVKALGANHNVSGFSGSVNDASLNIVKKSYSSLEDITTFTQKKDVLIFTSGPVDPRGAKESFLPLIDENLLLLKRFSESFFDQNPSGMFIFLSSAGSLYEVADSSLKFEESPLRPLSFYGELKLQQEEFLKKSFKSNVIILRLTNIYGDPFKKNQSTGLIDKLIKSLHTSEITEIFANIHSERDYLLIDDLCSLLCKIVDAREDKLTVYNVSSHECLSIESIISEINKVFSPEKIHVSFKNTSTIADKLVVNSNKARNVFGWHPQSLFRENLLQIKKRIQENNL